MHSSCLISGLPQSDRSARGPSEYDKHPAFKLRRATRACDRRLAIQLATLDQRCQEAKARMSQDMKMATHALQKLQRCREQQSESLSLSSSVYGKGRREAAVVVTGASTAAGVGNLNGYKITDIAATNRNCDNCHYDDNNGIDYSDLEVGGDGIHDNDVVNDEGVGDGKDTANSPIVIPGGYIVHDSDRDSDDGRDGNEFKLSKPYCTIAEQSKNMGMKYETDEKCSPNGSNFEKLPPINNNRSTKWMRSKNISSGTHKCKDIGRQYNDTQLVSSSHTKQSLPELNLKPDNNIKSTTTTTYSNDMTSKSKLNGNYIFKSYRRNINKLSTISKQQMANAKTKILDQTKNYDSCILNSIGSSKHLGKTHNQSCNFGMTRGSNRRCGHFPCHKPETYHSLGFRLDNSSTNQWLTWSELKKAKIDVPNPNTAANIRLSIHASESSSSELSRWCSLPMDFESRKQRLKEDIEKRRAQNASNKPKCWETNYGQITPYKVLAYPVRLHPLQMTTK